MLDTEGSFKFLGLTFDWPTIVSTTVTVVLALLIAVFLTRKRELKPGKRQTIGEMLVSFTNGLFSDQIEDKKIAKKYQAYGLAIFLFILIGNEIGLMFQVGNKGITYLKSPTASPVVTMTLALMSILIAHYAGIAKLGFLGYLKNAYLKPYAVLLPLNIIEALANLLTLGMRLFGNIFAGELLLMLISNSLALTNDHFEGIFRFIAGVPLEVIWQGFSVFIGAIQAYVFTTLSAVYIGQLSTKEE
jgi:F-type H+-transporting ATPase subunit a